MLVSRNRREDSAVGIVPDESMNQNSMWFLRPLLILLGALAFLLLFVVPLATSFMLRSMEQPPRFLLRNLDEIEWLQTISVQVITLAMFFFVGACFASFLNVVAWRVPRGRSIMGNSACPKCRHRLSFRDNFPVLGWLRNSGRCSHCGTQIPVRYLIVECVLGAIVLGVVLMTIAGGGMTLPVRTPNSAIGFERILFEAQWDLIKITTGHLLLVMTLFTFGLVESEGSRVPKSLLAWFGAFIVGWSIVAPELHLLAVDWPIHRDWPVAQAGARHWLTLLAGAGVGAMVGALLDRKLPVPKRQMAAGDTPMASDNGGRANPEQGVAAHSEHIEWPSSTQMEEPGGRKPSELPFTVSRSAGETTEQVVSDIGESGSHEDEAPADSAGSGRWVWGMIFVGAVLGWQSIPVISLWTGLIRSLARHWSLSWVEQSPSFTLLASVLVHLATWRWMDVCARVVLGG